MYHKLDVPFCQCGGGEARQIDYSNKPGRPETTQVRSRILYLCRWRPNRCVRCGLQCTHSETRGIHVWNGVARRWAPDNNIGSSVGGSVRIADLGWLYQEQFLVACAFVKAGCNASYRTPARQPYALACVSVAFVCQTNQHWKPTRWRKQHVLDQGWPRLFRLLFFPRRRLPSRALKHLPSCSFSPVLSSRHCRTASLAAGAIVLATD